MASTPTPIRLTDDERQRLHWLLIHHPELTTVADVLRQALTIGMLVMAVKATRPHHPGQFAGYAPDDLAALLAPRMMPVLAFLQARGAEAGLFVVAPPSPLLPAQAGPVELAGAGDRKAAMRLIDTSVADDLAAIGSDFLED